MYMYTFVRYGHEKKNAKVMDKTSVSKYGAQHNVITEDLTEEDIQQLRQLEDKKWKDLLEMDNNLNDKDRYGVEDGSNTKEGHAGTSNSEDNDSDGQLSSVLVAIKGQEIWYNPYPAIALEKEKARPRALQVNKKALTTRCNHKKRVFVIGLFKTGTTSMNAALSRLGYRCFWRSCQFVPAWEYGMSKSEFWQYLFMSADTIEWMHKVEEGYLRDLRDWSDRAGSVGDGPWLFLYTLLDHWYPGSKFILTVRNSTWDVVNSDVKMELRTKLHMDALWSQQVNATRPYTIELDTSTHRFYGVSLKEFAMLVARRYEIHNFKVRKYFENRPNDLLVLNLSAEKSNTLWKKLTDFLQCPHTVNATFPKKNTSPPYQQFVSIPKHTTFNWRQFNFSQTYQSVFQHHTSKHFDPILFQFVHGP
ncbi:hypothetical protein RFI_34165 [Reticulomyxa filosa]|uniref:Sulfotransferase domain-containing protein n=1 Tax=Reticulomyxa filosa TaxID=46433 RepID=X6LQ26_RETFI|nr:hypothetical protein RFI_34165 [Reticulomyxa filosa]|eukprot:ETO03247.1 hypothetical protein RFI_34165 [Reticulomyxa filosa]